MLQVNQPVKVKVLDIDRDRQRICLGLKQTQEDPWTKIVAEHRIGDVVEGRVTKIVAFGAFVEIYEGIEGLVHICELANRHVERPDEVVSVNQRILVKIIEIDSDRRRLSLSIKRVEGQVVEPMIKPEPIVAEDEVEDAVEDAVEELEEIVEEIAEELEAEGVPDDVAEAVAAEVVAEAVVEEAVEEIAEELEAEGVDAETAEAVAEEIVAEAVVEAVEEAAVDEGITLGLSDEVFGVGTGSGDDEPADDATDEPADDATDEPDDKADDGRRRDRRAGRREAGRGLTGPTA